MCSFNVTMRGRERLLWISCLENCNLIFWFLVAPQFWFGVLVLVPKPKQRLLQGIKPVEEGLNIKLKPLVHYEHLMSMMARWWFGFDAVKSQRFSKAIKSCNEACENTFRQSILLGCLSGRHGHKTLRALDKMRLQSVSHAVRFSWIEQAQMKCAMQVQQN